jgi:hypothetical protein
LTRPGILVKLIFEYFNIINFVIIGGFMIKIYIVFLLVLFYALPLFAQDPGNADTVRLANISGEIGSQVSMPVFLYNDEELISVTIPLLLTGYSGWLRFDSVSYQGSRLAGPVILDKREVDLFWTDTLMVDSVLLSFSVSSGNNLPIGIGKLCELWFTLHFGGGVLVDSLSESPKGGLSLTDNNGTSFVPVFSSGLVDIFCNYLAGDVDRDGKISTSDVVSIDNMWEYDYPLDSYPIYERYGSADLKCDRKLDLRDMTYLLGYLYRGLPSPCTCGTINSSYYNDPGLPDTVWVEDDTMILGIPSPICMGVINDEWLSGLALELEIDGSALLKWKSDSGLLPTDRLKAFEHWNKGEHADSLNPEFFYIYGWGFTVNFSPGRDAVCCPIFIPQSAGTATFRLVPWVNAGQSMMVTQGNAAILPAFYGGRITVLPYLHGDLNHDGTVTVADIVYLIIYLFKGGSAPDPYGSGDANCDGKVTISDTVFLVNYLFKGGPKPAC